MWRSWIFLIFLYPPFSNAQNLEEVANSKEWLRLLHYVPSGKGWESEVDGPEFFFAKDGRTNPSAELIASLAGMSLKKEIGRLKLQPQCAFPERYRFLVEKTGLKIERIKCPLFEDFMSRYQYPKKVSVVFSAAYPNNPASMFGHTFFKIESERKSDLLDYGISYAAEVPGDENPFAFMYFGLAGGYHGRWSMEPYFTKVNEYINSESRDLWEYELSLNEHETKRLLAHLWELEVTSYFDYYFLKQNCSYQANRAVEAIKPEWTISKHNIYIIPGETIKMLFDEPGVVQSIHYRPSLYNQLVNKYKQMSSKDKKIFVEFFQSAESNLGQFTDMSIANLEFNMLYARYVRQKRKNKLDAAEQAREQWLFTKRAERKNDVGLPTFNQEAKPSTQPELGHDPYSVSIFMGQQETGYRNDGGLYGFKWRSAYHDLMNNDVGYSAFSEIEFPWLEVKVFKNNFYLSQLGFINSTSMFPVSDIDQQLSWRFKLYLDRDNGQGCGNCLLQIAEGGGGYAFGSDQYRIYLFAIGRAELQKDLPKGFRTRPGIESGVIVNPIPKLKSRFQANVYWDMWPSFTAAREYQIKLDHSLTLRRNQEIRQSSLLYYSDDLNNRVNSEFRLDYVQYFR